MSDDAGKQITKNCHYISRFLTRPWEFDDRRGKGQLCYYDFDTDRFENRFAKTLFAETGLNSPTVETWLTEVLESPLGRIRSRLADGDPRALDDWPFFRAAMLMLWLQGLRSNSVAELGDRRALDDIAAMPIEHLDLMVNRIQGDYRLCLVFTTWTANQFSPLSVPSAGTFTVSVRDEGCASGFSLGVGLTVDPTCALVAIPVEQRGKIDDSLLGSSLANYSVGTSSSRRVVLHPNVRQEVPKGKLRTDLKELRAINDSLLADIQEVRGLIVTGFEAAGISTERDRIGRVIPPKP